MPPRTRPQAKSEVKVQKRNQNSSAGKPQSRQSSEKQLKPEERRVSGVNPRKVSEGLKQLPPATYQFVRESYLMLDSEGTGGISRETLEELLRSVGVREIKESALNRMLEQTGEPITFAGYIAVMGELLADLPAREEVDMMLEAFKTKDGLFSERDMKEALIEEGLRPEEIEEVVKRFSKPGRNGDEFDPTRFASTMSV